MGKLGIRYPTITYGTDPAIDDLEAVRTALGYDRINLIGGSYGTRVALVFARRYRARTRSLLLSGVTSQSYRIPLPHAQASERAFDALVTECDADDSCRSAYGNLAKLLDRVTSSLDRNPQTVPIPANGSGEPARLTLDGEMVRGLVHYSLYRLDTAVRLPRLLASADQGRIQPLANWAARLTGQFDRLLHLCMALSVICAEDAPRVSEEEITQAAKDSYLGDGFIRNLYGACRQWPAAKPAPEFFNPVHTDAPALLLSGAVDPVTPPEWGERLASRLSNARHVVVANKAHNPSWPGCAEVLAARFVEAGTADSLNAECLADIERPPFPTP